MIIPSVGVLFLVIVGGIICYFIEKFEQQDHDWLWANQQKVNAALKGQNALVMHHYGRIWLLSADGSVRPYTATEVLYEIHRLLPGVSL